MERETLRERRRRLRRRQALERMGRVAAVVIGALLLITVIWQFAGPRLAARGIDVPADGVVDTVQAAAPEKEDGSGSAGILTLQATRPANQTPGWQYDSAGWWYAPDDNTYYANGWQEIDGQMYHFDSSGYMTVGWKAIGGRGCYFAENGVYDPDRDSSMMLALTFDDGPGKHTGELLDVLESTGAKATFFMQGCNVEKYGADTVSRMAALGCDLGNHSYDHPNMLELSMESAATQFQMTDDLIAQYNNGKGASVIRFPYGNDSEELIRMVNRPCFRWDVDTLDWENPRSVERNISYVLEHAQPGDIVLMHDTYQETVEACKTIIPELVNKGYELVTVRVLAEARGVPIENARSYFGFTDAEVAKELGETS